MPVVAARVAATAAAPMAAAAVCLVLITFDSPRFICLLWIELLLDLLQQSSSADVACGVFLNVQSVFCSHSASPDFVVPINATRVWVIPRIALGPVIPVSAVGLNVPDRSS